jgi:hypothetical protein
MLATANRRVIALRGSGQAVSAFVRLTGGTLLSETDELRKPLEPSIAFWTGGKSLAYRSI